MTRPKPPRLPEFGGMTEAGFNRVVSMITHREFMRPVPWELAPWSNERARAECEREEWFTSLPKTRNKKQRKAANVPRWTEEDIRKMHEGSSEIDAFFEGSYHET